MEEGSDLIMDIQVTRFRSNERYWMASERFREPLKPFRNVKNFHRGIVSFP